MEPSSRDNSSLPPKPKPGEGDVRRAGQTTTTSANQHGPMTIPSIVVTPAEEGQNHTILDEPDYGLLSARLDPPVLSESYPSSDDDSDPPDSPVLSESDDSSDNELGLEFPEDDNDDPARAPSERIIQAPPESFNVEEDGHEAMLEEGGCMPKNKLYTPGPDLTPQLPYEHLNQKGFKESRHNIAAPQQDGMLPEKATSAEAPSIPAKAWRQHGIPPKLPSNTHAPQGPKPPSKGIQCCSIQ